MKKVLTGVSLYAFPSIALAASINPAYLEEIIGTIKTILGWAVPLLISLAFVWFLYNVFVYVIKTDPDGKEGARKQMIYGIIGLAIMVAVWGLVKIVTNFFGVNDTTVPTLPSVPLIP